MARQRTPTDIARLRLSAQNILGTRPEDPLSAVRTMTAMQAQDLPGTLWAIGLRSGATEREVRDVFDRAELIRSWPMRGTLHALTPDDLRLILPLSRDRVIASLAARHRELGIGDKDVLAVRRAVEATLTTRAQHLTRAELFAVFEQAGQPAAGQRGSHLAFMLAHLGLICLRPFVGKEQAFVLLDAWAPASTAPADRSEALASLAYRYFSSHGPATVEDFAWWTKLTLTDARAATAAVRDDLATMSVDGKDYLASPQFAELTARPPGARSVCALPGFDEFLLGYTDRSAALAAEHSQLIVPGNNGMFKATVVVGGRVVGTWTRSDRAASVDVTIHPFRDITETEASALSRVFDRYGSFRSKQVSLTIEPRSG
jgi:hypothetical protein